MTAQPSHSEAVDRVFHGFRIATMAPAGSWLGGHQGNLVPADPCGILENYTLATRGERIAWICHDRVVPQLSPGVEIIEGRGQWLTPGLIDCHTHLVYGGNRAHEWEARLQGATYAEIARAGGGILSSVRHTRAASEESLYQSAQLRLLNLMQEGITTIEIKSGYGLDLDSELKMLRVAKRLGDSFQVNTVPTLLAAHAVPEEFQGRGEAFVDWVCKEMIPAAREHCVCVDAFCESIAFNLKQTERIFQAAKDQGLQIKVHAEQLSSSGSAAMAAKMGAISADHLEYLSDADCQILADHGTVATLLPGAFYCLREKQLPPVESLRRSGATIAIASDSNPGSSPLVSILIAANMACNLFRLTVDEAWLGMTRHAAQALRKEPEVGSLQPGHYADLAIWKVDRLAEVLYMIGHNPCSAVYYRGRLRQEPPSPL